MYARSHPQFDDDIVPALLERYISSKSFPTILDAGCGEGSLVRALIKRSYVGERVLACDASSTRVAHLARERAPIHAFVDDVEELKNVKSGSVDFFISSQVIEHVDDVRMLNAVARVTYPGSLIYLSTIQKRWYGWYFYRSKAGWALDPTHLREYRSDEELFDRIDPKKFVVIENQKTPLLFPIADFILRCMREQNHDPFIYRRNALLKTLRKIAFPVIGYSMWELILERR